MLVRWSRHAKMRFAERAVYLGINYGDIELEIKRQSLKIKIAKNKFKTIFAIGAKFLTAIKIEKKDFIHVLTLWEASESETEEWKEKK